MKTINNKNMIWIATANLIHPVISPSQLVTANQIKDELSHLFGDVDNATTTSFQIARHLISWHNRDADSNDKRRGGDRSRFLFRTSDGKTPSNRGKYRLYKQVDSQYDGQDKTGSIHPEKADIPAKYHYLIDWYKESYFESQEAGELSS